jgi:HAD superfamily hydrolase (TIGR01509 family)
MTDLNAGPALAEIDGRDSLSPKLVIFDLDGVLVDTQEAENDALKYLAELMGVRLAPDEATDIFSGRRMRECIDFIEERSQCAPPPDAMDIVRAKTEDIIGSELEPIAGVEYALGRIRIDMCVASNSPKHIMERRLEAAGILHYFGGRLYSAYEIEAWKPDPTLFLWAARDCRVDARDCVVIEDSPVGVDAAVTAGMRVLQFSADPDVAPHRASVETFSSMQLLPQLIVHPATADFLVGIRR